MYLIKDECIGLIPFEQPDMRDWLVCWQDKATQRGFNFIPPDHEAWSSSQVIEHFPFWVAAVDLSNGAKVGTLRLSPDESPDLAIWIYPKYRGQGWGSRAYKMACDYLFDKGYQTIYAGCFPYNTPSMNVLQKTGFVRWQEGDTVETSVFDGSKLTMLGFKCEL